MSRHIRPRLLAAAIAMGCAASFGATPALAVAPALVTLAQPATHLRQGDVASGALAMSQPIHIEVALKLRNAAGLHALVSAAQAAPGSAHLTGAQFVSNYAPTADQAGAVAAYLKAAGFSDAR